MQPRHDSATNRSRLAALDRLANTGDEQAEGEARRLRHWMQMQEQVDQKRQDDRMKVLVGAAVLELLKTGHPVILPDHQTLLELMDQFLARPGERTAVLGDDGRGSEALHRVIGITGGQGVADATAGGESPPTPDH